LRPYRLRPHTYPGQDEPVELLSSQVLLAARSATGHTGVDAAGPAAALPASSPPLTSTQREALAEAVGIAESPDPAVPSPWSLRGPPTAAPSAPWADTLLNVFVIGFLGWLFAMVVARPR
jgi:hypothetical protein